MPANIILRQHRALIHSHTVLAGAAAAGIAAPPLMLVGLAAEIVRLDPVTFIQCRLVRQLCQKVGMDPDWAIRQLGLRAGNGANRRMQSQLARKAAAQGLETAARLGVERITGRSLGRMVPAAGVAIAGALAMRETRQLAVRCLQLRAISKSRSRRG